MTTHSTTGSTTRGSTTPRGRRWLAGTGVLLLFGVLFALPLCAALVLCTMPCCHHPSDPAAALAAGGMAGCAEQCAIRSDEAAPAAVAAVLQDSSTARIAHVAAATVVVSAAPAPVAPAGRGADVSHRTGASVRVLSSVFRI
jgi:hypothetical protein